MMLIFAMIEDILAATFSGAIIIKIFETIPLIFIISLIFTFITELIEEKFEYGKQPLERIIDKTFEYLKENKIKPTHENVKKHLKIHTETLIDKTFEHLKKHEIKPTYENVRKYMKKHARMYRRK